MHPSSYDSTASCLGASLSFGNAGLHGYGEGREEEGGGEKKKGRGVLSLRGGWRRSQTRSPSRLSPPNRPPATPAVSQLRWRRTRTRVCAPAAGVPLFYPLHGASLTRVRRHMLRHSFVPSTLSHCLVESPMSPWKPSIW